MGACGCSRNQTVYVPDPVFNPEYSNSEKMKIALKLRLMDVKKIEDVPVLRIATSKMYQKRKERVERDQQGSMSPETAGQTSSSPLC